VAEKTGVLLVIQTEILNLSVGTVCVIY